MAESTLRETLEQVIRRVDTEDPYADVACEILEFAVRRALTQLTELERDHDELRDAANILVSPQRTISIGKARMNLISILGTQKQT